jgi:hypothetical protein
MRATAVMRERAAADATGRRRAIIGTAAAAALIAAGVVISLVSRASPVPGPLPAPLVAADTVDGGLRTIDSAAAVVETELPIIVDVGDSSRASGWSVELARFSTSMGALIRVRDQLPATVPVRTFALVPSVADRTLWFRVLAGASTTRAGADSLLASLRSSKVIDDSTAGVVVHAPLAFRVEQDVAAGSADASVKRLLARTIPAYALLQDDGTATVYAGAFESAEQAALLIPSLRAAGIEPALVYRLGRTF